MFNIKRIKSLAAVLCVLAMSSSWAQTAPPSVAQSASCPALLNHTFPRLQDEKPQSLCQYSGKVILVVNTASYCGFTSQYKGLEAVYSQYKDKGLVVLGFPSNDFAQEKANNQDIADFCESTFGVLFRSHQNSRYGRCGRTLFQAVGPGPWPKTQMEFLQILNWSRWQAD